MIKDENRVNDMAAGCADVGEGCSGGVRRGGPCYPDLGGSES
jgi:hypothetical protein